MTEAAPNVRTYENIWLAAPVPKSAGRFRLVERGLGWQDRQDTSQRITVDASEIRSIIWSRCAKDYSLKIVLSDGKFKRFDGFPYDAFKDLNAFVSQHYNIKITQKEMSVRGWNWGTVDINSSALTFQVGGKPVFEIPIEEIANVNNQNKDVSIDIKETSQQTVLPAGVNRRIRDDVLVQMQLYIPGTVDDEIEVEDEEGENTVKSMESAKAAAVEFANRLKRETKLGVSVGEEIEKFEKIMCLAPRGRFDLTLYPSYMRMVGTSQDISIQYKNIIRLFLLPRPDLIYHNLVIALHPPLRQGNTKYPFLVFHFDESEHSVNFSQSTIQKTKGKLMEKYDGLLHEVFSDIISGITDVDIVYPDNSYRGRDTNTGIKCSYKAAESFLYMLEDGIIAVPKPTIYLKRSIIERFVFSRVGGGAATRTMEMRIESSEGSFAFANIPREEHPFLEEYCHRKKIKIENELDELASGVNYDLGSDVSDEEDTVKRKRDESGEDEDESEDEDFVDNDDAGSDVPEEYNADYKGGNSDSDEEDGEPSPKKPKSSSDSK